MSHTRGIGRKAHVALTLVENLTDCRTVVKTFTAT